jgi:hypothetical protein
MKKLKAICMTIVFLTLSTISSHGIESTFRLLSVSESEKLILVSQIPSKTKYLLDASSAKITINGKPAEYKSLKAYSVLHLKMETRKSNKDGIDLDGVAIEIKISTEEKPNQ